MQGHVDQNGEYLREEQRNLKQSPKVEVLENSVVFLRLVLNFVLVSGSVLAFVDF